MAESEGLSGESEKVGDEESREEAGTYEAGILIKKDGEGEFVVFTPPSGFPEVVQRYLVGLARTGTQRSACIQARIGYKWPYVWREEVKGFEDAEARAREYHTDYLEQILFEKVKNNPTLLIFALKGGKPEKYKDLPPQTAFQNKGVTVVFNVPRPQKQAEISSDTIEISTELSGKIG